MLGELLRRDRERLGHRVGQAAWLLDITLAEYRRLEQGALAQLGYDRTERLFGWPRPFAGTSA